MKEESLLLLSDLQKLINQVVLIDYIIIILGDDKMVKTEAFPTIRMKIDRLLKITNEYQFNDLVKAVYCINLCINNRSVLESCLALNACLIEYEEKGSKRIGTYDEFTRSLN